MLRKRKSVDFGYVAGPYEGDVHWFHGQGRSGLDDADRRIFAEMNAS
jgi:hypothetical protein